MFEKRRSLILFIVLFLLGLIIGGIGIWYFRGAEVSNLKKKVSRLESQLKKAKEATSEEVSTETATQQTTEGAEAESKTPQSTAAESPKVERQFCYIKDANESAGKFMLVVDYAQFLTGEEAAQAAAARGDESPPPNDYYIVNDNPRLRTFPVDNRVMKVFLHVRSDGTTSDRYEIRFGEWFDWFNGMSGGSNVIKMVPYWITITGGKITKIEEQYLP